MLEYTPPVNICKFTTYGAQERQSIVFGTGKFQLLTESKELQFQLGGAIDDSNVSGEIEPSLDVSKVEKPISLIAKQNLSKFSKEELDSNWLLHEFFENIFVINLDRSSDRLNHFTKEIQSIGVPSFQRFPAVDGATDVPSLIWNKFYINRCHLDLSTDVGQKIFTRIRKREAGCFLSCLGVYRKVKKEFDTALANLRVAEKSCDALKIMQAKAEVAKTSRALIFEDDAAFGFLQGDIATREGVGYYFNKALAQVPDDWDILYLFAYPFEPTKRITEDIYQVFGMWCLMAYAIRYTVYDELVKEFEKVHNDRVYDVATSDLTLAAFQGKYKAYALSPPVVYAIAGQSTITGEVFAPYQPISQFFTKD